jgi:hypothetical protein
MSARQKILDRIVIFMVIYNMKEYDSIAYQQHPPAISSLDCTLATSPVVSVPNKIEFNNFLSQDRKPELKIRISNRLANRQCNS